jgi:hypothetical protein
MKLLISLALAVFILLSPITSSVSAASITDPSIKGRVVNLPIAGTPVKWVITNNQEDGYVMLVSLNNVCGLGNLGTTLGCTDATNSETSGGTAWNSNGGNNNNAGYTASMTNVLTAIYNNLPNTIAGFGKGDIILNKSWDMDGFYTTGARSDGYNSPNTRPVNLVSYYEWQTGLDTGSGDSSSYQTEPADNSVGDLWCQAQYGPGAVCLGRDIGSGFRTPWLRSARSDDGGSAWIIMGDSQGSLNYSQLLATRAVLPALWLSGAVQIQSGTGTFNDPYGLNIIPALTSVTSLTDGWYSSVTGHQEITVSGAVSDLDNGQTLTIQYQIDDTGEGSWTQLKQVNSPADNEGFSRTLTIGSDTGLTSLADGSHTIYLRVTDETDTSGNSSTTFRLDNTKPTCTSWSPSEAAWKTSGSETFTSVDCSDGGAGLLSSNNYSCTTGSAHGDTCSVTISDNAGNTESFNSPTNRIDTTAPGTLTVSDSSSNWSNVTPSPTITVQDTQSGLGTLRYAWNDNNSSGISDSSCSGGTAISVTSESVSSFTSETLTPPGEGDNTLHVCATDSVGNIAYTTGSYKYHTADFTCGEWSPDASGWKNTNTEQHFALSGSTTTGGSGMDVDSGECDTGPNNGDTCKITISDNAGNEMECVSPANRVDKTQPTCGAWSPDAAPWKQSGDQEFTLSNSLDDESGIKTAGGSCTTGTAAGDTCTVTIEDYVGNTRSCTSPANRLDAIAPETLTVSGSSSSWSNTTPSPTITVQDTQSGLESLRYAWNDNNSSGINDSSCSGGTPATALLTPTFTSGNTSNFVTSALTPPEEGDNTLHVCATDGVGNIAYTTGSYKYHTADFTCGDWSPTVSPWKNTNTGQHFTLSGSGTSGGSEMDVSGGNCDTGTNNGDTCKITISDNASNSIECESPPNYVDTSLPTLTFNNSSASESAKATITITDPLSGLATIYYRWNDDTEASASACGGAGASPLTGFGVGTTSEWTNSNALTPPVGVNTLYVCVIDSAGNIAASSAPYFNDGSLIESSDTGASNSTGSSTNHNLSSSLATPPGCHDLIPPGQADLFQIDRRGTSATLYFTPVSDNTNRYHLVFGHREGEELYGWLSALVTSEANTGVQSLTVSDLSPYQTYSFQVLPVNGCAVGERSNWLTSHRDGASYRYLP